MRILFCYPNIDTRTKPEIHLGLGYMSALLARSGHHTSLYWPQRLSRRGLVRAIEHSSPDIIAFSVTSYQYDFALQLARWAREACSAKILFGGIHPTLAPEDVIRRSEVDMLCRGEGERAIHALAEQRARGGDITGIQNLWIKGAHGGIERNEIGPLIEDLDALPYPDREIFNIRDVINRNGYRFEILSGRGCPFSCTYCCNHVLRRLSKGRGNYVRKRTVGNVLDEIRFLSSRYRMDSILFHDDTFTLNRHWLFDFCDRYGAKFRIPFHCLARVETIDGELAAALRAAGCRAVSLGVESGSERIRREILKRGISDEQIKNAFQILKSKGIKRFSFNMVGVRGETVDDIDATIRLNREIDPDWMGVLVFTPYPGTELHALCEREGYITSTRYPSNYLTEKSFMLTLPGLPRRQLIRKYRKFQTIAYGKYIKQNYRMLYPFFALVRPILGTWLHGPFSAIAYKLLFKK